MKRLPLTIIILIILYSCNKKQDKDLQLFPEYNLALSCPCVLERDIEKENKVKTEIGNNTVSLNCSDTSNGDKYHLDILLNNRKNFSNNEILLAIDSALTARQIKHERKIIANNEGIIINYGKAKELELFTKDLSYYIVIEATDSLDAKFDKFINSITIE